MATEAGMVMIRLGAGIDTSLERSFAAIEHRSLRAGRAVARNLARGFGGASGAPDRAQAASLRRQEADVAASARRRGRVEVTEAERAINAIDRARRRGTDRAIAEQARMQSRVERDARRAAATQQRELERFATRTSHRATRFFWPNMPITSIARRFGGDVARGMGVDFNVGSLMARSVENEAQAARLANQAYNPHDVKWEQRIKPEQIRAASQAIANKYAYTENEVTAAMQAYTNLTGDLKSAIPLMDKLALLSKSTGTELSDAANAAADMGVALEKAPNKEQALMTVMGIAAMQGKTGALEIFQLAPQMPRIVSQAGQFAGAPDKNIASLLASTQLIRRYGGVGTPSQAATALVGAVAALQKGGGAAFKKAGVNVRDARGQLLPIADIVEKSLEVSSKGGVFNAKTFFSMWNAQRGGRLAVGLKKVFDEAGGMKINPITGKTAGEEAIREQYAKFTRPLETSEQERMAGDIAKTTESKARVFQNALDKMADSLRDRLTPQLEKLVPTITSLADTITKAASWAAENPKAALAAMAGISLGRAGIESAFRAGIEARILGSAGVWQAARGGGGVVAAGGATAAGGRLLGAGATGAAGGGLILPALAAAAGVGLAADQFSKLTKETGTKRSLTDVLPKSGDELMEMMIPGLSGFKSGHFRWQDAAEGLLPFRAGKWLAGTVADVTGGDERMNAAARAAAGKRTAEAAQAKTEGRADYAKWENLPAANQAAAQSDAVRAGTQPVVNAINQLAKTPLNVRISNLPEAPPGNDTGRVSFFD